MQRCVFFYKGTSFLVKFLFACAFFVPKSMVLRFKWYNIVPKWYKIIDEANEGEAKERVLGFDKTKKMRIFAA